MSLAHQEVSATTDFVDNHFLAKKETTYPKLVTKDNHLTGGGYGVG